MKLKTCGGLDGSGPSFSNAHLTDLGGDVDRGRLTGLDLTYVYDSGLVRRSVIV